jgi:hypothetical protein
MEFRNDLYEAIADAIKEATSIVFGESAAEHFEDVTGRIEGIQQAGQVGAKRGRGTQCLRAWDLMARMLARQMIFALQVGLSDLEIEQSHLRTGVPE